ncbi:MAG TPA: transporter substrate-binding domain-containing protein, partial [Candidatus Methylomirabilis sp.]|nr:transporter substrate-binding domain-containing protein [Candidatus Methylomirabilis sp.]
EQVDFANPFIHNVAEILVTGPGAEPIGSVQELSGKEVYLRKSSSFYESIQRLNAEFAQRGQAPVKVRSAPETLEIEDILEMVNAGLVKATIVDRHMAAFWSQIFTKLTLHPDIAVRTGGEIGWMVRKNSPQLKAELNALLARYPEGSTQRNMILQKYLKDTKWAKAATSEEELSKFERTVAFFRRYGFRYNMDYLLMVGAGLPGIAAQSGAQESPWGDRGDATDARHRQGDGGGRHPADGAQHPRRGEVHALHDGPVLRQRAHGPAEPGLFTFASQPHQNPGDGLLDRLSDFPVHAAPELFRQPWECRSRSARLSQSPW